MKGRKQSMKKVICLIAIALMIASVTFAAGKLKFTAKDLPGLKGTWEGVVSFGEFEGGGTSPMKLEILNDAAPLKAKVTVTNIPQQIAGQFSVPSGQNVFENDGGVLTSQGTISWASPQGTGFMEISKGENKINFWYFNKGLKGDATLKKKK
jgi:hypothetical protein